MPQDDTSKEGILKGYREGVKQTLRDAGQRAVDWVRDPTGARKQPSRQIVEQQRNAQGRTPAKRTPAKRNERRGGSR